LEISCRYRYCISLRTIYYPKGGFGIAVIGEVNVMQLESLKANEPANGLNTLKNNKMSANA